MATQLTNLIGANTSSYNDPTDFINFVVGNAPDKTTAIHNLRQLFDTCAMYYIFSTEDEELNFMLLHAINELEQGGDC